MSAKELEVGMYIRYDYYTGVKIGKIIKIWNDDEQYSKLLCDLDNKDVIDEFDVIGKPSHNIIDLIEEKDFFEIEFYSERCKERITKIFQVDYIIEDNICLTNGDCQLNILHGKWSNQDKELNPIIKRVLTHEQFEREAYKV